MCIIIRDGRKLQGNVYPMFGDIFDGGLEELKSLPGQIGSFLSDAGIANPFSKPAINLGPPKESEFGEMDGSLPPPFETRLARYAANRLRYSFLAVSVLRL